MRSLFILLSALCALAVSQMTFTDQWNKRSAPFEPFVPLKTSGHITTCDHRSIEDMLVQLTQLHAAQNEIVTKLSTCTQTNRH